MMMRRYNVVFRGACDPECDIESAKADLAKAFKLNPKAVDTLFSGRTVTVRKRADEALARSLQRTASGCGVIFELEPIEETDTASASIAKAPADAADDTVKVACPHCGFSQNRASTCLKCGEFLIKPVEKPRQAPIAVENVAVSATPRQAGSNRSLWKKARISILLLILLGVGVDTFMTGRWATDWDDPLWVGVYPINGERQEHIDAYIGNLKEETFLPIADFFAVEADNLGLPLAEPFTVRLAPPVDELPPPPPSGGNPLSIMWWSLKMRYWAFQHDTFAEGPSPDIKIYLIYHDARSSDPLENSLGIRKGMFGVVHAYADRRLEPKNQVMIAHEILHTVGAKDKYNLATQQPIFPQGYANPDARPLHPQKIAEIMGSRIPLTETRSKMPPSLNDTIIGPQTAREIKWITARSQ